MPGIVPLGNPVAAALAYTPPLGSAGLRSRCSSYQALLAAVAAGAKPHTCPTLAVCVEKFLRLSARLAGCGDSPPQVRTEKQVMSLVLCSMFDSYLVFLGSAHHATQSEVGLCGTCCLCRRWPAPGTQILPRGMSMSDTAYCGLIITTCLAGQDHPACLQAGEEGWWLVCLCWGLLGLSSLQEEAPGHRRDRLGGAEGTEIVLQCLATVTFNLPFLV